MPHRVWTHRCSEGDTDRTLNKPVCDRCGAEGAFVGWRYGMHEDMGRYQTFYRLKPVGAHRPMADELFRELSVPCEACEGRGLLDHPPGCACCPSCKGLARHFTVPVEVVASIREQILEEFPDAGAEPVQHFPYGVMIHDLEEGLIIGFLREAPGSEPGEATGASRQRPTDRGGDAPGDMEEDAPGNMEEDAPGDMHPGYFTTHFRDYDEIEEWPDEFVIISAHATTGETWTDEENDEAFEALWAVLRERGVWTHSVLGFSTESDHAELSWAAALSLAEARAIGSRFLQDAIFHVRGDHLSVTRCDHGAALVPVGSFRERLHVGSEPHRRLSIEEGSPWRLLTPELLNAALGRHLQPDPTAGELGDRVLMPRDEILLGEALVEAMPDEASRRAAEEDLEWDHVFADDVALLLDDPEDGGWVVECEVTDSMVSGVWGLTELRVGDRGYLLDMPDFGATDQKSPGIVSGWIGHGDETARRACIVSTYVRLWDHIGLPPLLGQWVAGEPKILLSGLLAALATPKGTEYWPQVLARIREEDLYSVASSGWEEIAQRFGVPLNDLIELLERPEGERARFEDRARRGELAEDERLALGALYLTSIMQEFLWLSRQSPGRRAILGDS